MLWNFLLLLNEPDAYVARVLPSGEIEIVRRDSLPASARVWPRGKQ